MKGLDKFLFWYTLLFAIILTASTVSRGFSSTNLILVALFLPLTVYTVLQAIKRYYVWKQTRISDPSLGTRDQGPSTFSLAAFLSQKHPLFVITIILFSVAFLTTIIRFAPLARR